MVYRIPTRDEFDARLKSIGLGGLPEWLKDEMYDGWKHPDPTDLIGGMGTVGKVSKKAAKTVCKTEGHHLLSREFKPFFKKAKLEIEEYVLDLARGKHRLKPDGLHTGPENWNKLWRDFFKDVVDPTKKQILNQLEWMKKKFGL